MRHQLSLEIPDTNNTKVFRVYDTSIYANGLPIKCGRLSIKAPGFEVTKTLEMLPHFNLALNACSLGIYTGSCSDNSPGLPDGIYTVTYTVSPNDKVYVQYNFLRVTNLLNRYNEELCKLDFACEPDSTLKARLKDLRFIKDLIDGAKAKVEVCNSPSQGIEQFKFASKKLNDLQNPSC